MAGEEKSGWLPKKVARYAAYVVAFFVTYAAAISPIWLSNKTGYTAILDLFPQSLREVTIPCASFLFSALAVGVQFFDEADITRKRMKYAFVATGALLAAGVFLLLFRYQATVVRVYVPASEVTVSYLVGNTPLPTCECAKRGLDIRDCIASSITVNPYDVEKCYPRQEIAMNGWILSGLYMFVMSALGTLIGLIVLKKPQPDVNAPEPA